MSKALKIVVLTVSSIVICSLIVAVAGESRNEDKYLPCRLVWIYMGTGDVTPNKAVPVHNDKEYAVRVKNPADDRFAVGSYSLEEQRAYFPFEDVELNSTGTGFTSFEILTNPFDCLVSWPQESNGSIPDKFAWGASEDEWGYYVGRGYVEPEGGDPTQGHWVTGQVSSETGGLELVIDGEADFLEEYQVLISYSKGFRLQVTNFVFTNDPLDGDLGQLGIDTIRNDADVEISKLTTHRRTMTETTSIRTFSQSTSKNTDSSGFDIFFAGSTKQVEHTYKESVEETLTTTKVTEILLEKELLIPPKTAVTACSTVILLDNFSSAFTAKGVYSAPGMTPNETLTILKDEGIEGPTLVTGESGNDEVVVQISGIFEGSLSLDSQFVAVPYGDSCMDLQKSMFAKRRGRLQQKYLN